MIILRGIHINTKMKSPICLLDVCVSPVCMSKKLLIIIQFFRKRGNFLFQLMHQKINKNKKKAKWKSQDNHEVAMYYKLQINSKYRQTPRKGYCCIIKLSSFSFLYIISFTEPTGLSYAHQLLVHLSLHLSFKA